MHWHEFYEKSNFLHQHLSKGTENGGLSSLQVYWIHSSTFSLVFFGADLRYTRTLHLFFGISMCHEVIPNLHVFDTEHDEKKHENKLSRTHCWWYTTYFFQCTSVFLGFTYLLQRILVAFPAIYEKAWLGPFLVHFLKDCSSGHWSLGTRLSRRKVQQSRLLSSF